MPLCKLLATKLASSVNFRRGTSAYLDSEPATQNGHFGRCFVSSPNRARQTAHRLRMPKATFWGRFRTIDPNSTFWGDSEPLTQTQHFGRCCARSPNRACNTEKAGAYDMLLKKVLNPLTFLRLPSRNQTPNNRK